MAWVDQNEFKPKIITNRICVCSGWEDLDKHIKPKIE